MPLFIFEHLHECAFATIPSPIFSFFLSFDLAKWTLRLSLPQSDLFKSYFHSSEEEAIKKRWGDGCRNLQKWLQDNWWKPWYETEDDVPDEEKQALKVMGEELASGLHLFGSLLDDDDTAVGDDEDSEYFFRGIARAISGIRRRKKGGRRKGKKGCKCC